MENHRNIIIISAVYPPEPQVSARMSFDLANYLADKGYCITVLCPQPSRPLNADYSQYSNPVAPVVTSENKVKVVRLPSFAAPQSRLLPRMWESFNFGREATKYLVKVKLKTDLLYVNSWPLFAQTIIARFAKRNSIPMALQIMDIYPEALTSKLPTFMRFVVHTPLKCLDTWIARTATRVVVISENMRRTYTESRQISGGKIVSIPTWQDETIFDNLPARSACCDRYGISSNPFTFLFLGNIGPVAGVDFLIRAFANADLSDSQLLIIGDGAAKADCVALAESLRLSSVHFISDPDAANVPILQSMAHVFLLPMKCGAAMSSIPSKFPSYLFSAKPVIATVDLESDTARFIREADCGWVGKSEDLDWLVNTMKTVSQQSPDQLESVGLRGKLYGLAHFSKSTCVVRLAETIINAAGGTR